MKKSVTYFYPILFVWLWSSGFISTKYGLPYIEPFYLLVIRATLSIATFALLLLILKQTWLTHTLAFQQLIVGALLHGGYLGGVFYAIKSGMPAGMVSIIVGIQPILTTLLNWLVLGQRIGRWQVLGLLLGFMGVFLVISGHPNKTPTEGYLNHAGLIASLLALLSISFGTILQKQWGKNTPLLSGTLCQYVGLLLVAGFLTTLTETQTVLWTLPLILAIGWLVLGLSVFAVLLLLYMMREGEITTVLSYFYLVPPLTALQAWWLFDERLSPLAMLGCALSVVGVVLVMKTAKMR